MSTIRKSKTTADVVEKAWPTYAHPTAALVEDAECPFYVAPEMRDDYWQRATDPTWFRQMTQKIGDKDNKVIFVLQFGRAHGLITAPVAPRRGRAETPTQPGDQARALARTLEQQYGVDYDGIWAHQIAHREAMQIHKHRIESAQTRSWREQRLTCTCCQRVDNSTRARTAAPVDTSPLAKAEASLLCEPCWFTAQQITAEKAVNRATVEAYLSKL